MALSTSRRARRLAIAVVGALAAGAVLSAQPAGAAPEPSAQAPVQAVRWGPCPAELLELVPPAERHLYSCGSHPVPINHQQPGQGTIDLALMRRAAANPSARIGSMFFNPGGPGSPGFVMPLFATGFFQPEVLDRFDMVGFDPRGVSQSAPLRCFTTQEEADQVRGRLVTVPVTTEEIRGTMAAYRDYGGHCTRNAGRLAGFMSTQDVARDLDVLRAAVGDPKLTYVGFSYGTLIGATYQNLFPRKVRAILLDGAVDPNLRTNNAIQYDRERAQGYEIALDGFLARCEAEGAKCAFSEGDPRAKFDEVRERLRKGPVAMPDGTVTTLNTFTNSVANVLQAIPMEGGGAPPLAQLAKDLQALYQVVHPRPGARVEPLTLLNKPAAPNRGDAPYTGDDSFFGVNCSDKPFPKLPETVPLYAALWEKESRTFARYQAFADFAGCASLPFSSSRAYKGPWNAKTGVPTIVISNRYDAPTRHDFGRRMASQLADARFVTVEAFGHGSLGASACVDAIATKYLTTLAAPATGVICHPNVQPF